jgi:hypothetical protein
VACKGIRMVFDATLFLHQKTGAKRPRSPKGERETDVMAMARGKIDGKRVPEEDADGSRARGTMMVG